MRSRMWLALSAVVLPVVFAIPSGIAESVGEHAGSETCLGCHEDAADSLVHHGGDPGDPACESCHGEVKAQDRLKGKRFKMGFCLDCHREKKAPVGCWLSCHN